MESKLVLSPTAFTTEFFSLDFSPFRYLLQNIKDDSHPSRSDLPAVAIKGFDRKTISKVEGYCRSHMINHFQPVPTQKFYSDWCYLVRSHGWSNLIIKNVTNKSRDYNGTLTEIPYEINTDQTLVDLCRDMFGEWWNSLVSLKIMKLDAHGWVNPHRDLAKEDYNLCNFWMPLHDFDKGIKVFPLGWLTHAVGDLYLFNQSRYPHAVINPTNHPRLAMVGKFDIDSIHAEIVDQFTHNKTKFLDLWT